jgi:hypothetical protein
MNQPSSPSRASDAILVVYPFCLDHVGHGNIQRCLALSRHLAKSGFAVDLVYLASQHLPPVPEQYTAFRNVHRVVEPRRSLATAAWGAELQQFYGTYEPPEGFMRPPPAFTALTRALLDTGGYRAVIGNYVWTAPILAPLQGRVLRICDAHDVIHQFARAHDRVTGEKSFFTMAPETEAFLWRQFDVVAAITPEDAARIQREMLPNQRVISVRHAAPSIVDECVPGPDDTALYAGSDNGSNVKAVTWLLDEVWPLVRQARPNATLKLAGLICRALPERVRDMPGVELLGFRPDLAADFAACGVFVAPFLFGSGLKIKVVEAACAGKAIVTTRDGVIGSGLTPGDAVAVHDDAEAFAAAAAALLGDAAARRSMADRALTEARRLFSPSACYDIVAETIRSMAVAAGDDQAGPGGLDRVKEVWDRARPERVAIWGNGAHTRTLIQGLKSLSIPVSFIVDRRATAIGVSPEGLPVLPATESGLRVDDLLVLSSEVFEAEMWKDLEPWRQSGGYVIGLYDSERISRGLRKRLTGDAQPEISRVNGDHAPALAARARLVIWDSGPLASRWARLSWIAALGAAAEQKGMETIVVTSTRQGGAGAPPHELPDSIAIVPMLDLDARAFEAQNPEAELGDLARLSDRIARTATQAVQRLALTRRDVLVCVSPALVECLALPRALRAVPAESRPRVILHDVTPAAGEEGWTALHNGDLHALYRFALGDLRDAVDGRMGLTVDDCLDASTAAAWTGRFAEVAGHPLFCDAAPPARSGGDTSPRPSILCFGHFDDVFQAWKLKLLQTERQTGGHDWQVLWRSTQGDGIHEDMLRAQAFASASLPVEVLDAAPPAAVREAVAGASVIVILSERHGSDWCGALCAYAERADVPVIAPEGGIAARYVDQGVVRGTTYTPLDAQRLAALVQATLDPQVKRRTAAPREPALEASPRLVLDRLLRSASGAVVSSDERQKEHC